MKVYILKNNGKRRAFASLTEAQGFLIRNGYSPATLRTPAKARLFGHVDAEGETSAFRIVQVKDGFVLERLENTGRIPGLMQLHRRRFVDLARRSYEEVRYQSPEEEEADKAFFP